MTVVTDQTLDTEGDIKNFADAATNYCSWAESLDKKSEEDLIIARKLLLDLHGAVIRLKDIDCEEDTDDVLSHDDWKLILDRFKELPVDLYWDVFDTLKEEPPVLNSLADDLADIYHDVKEGLVLYDQGLINEAVWEWRFNFLIHWGAHLTGAQRAIHGYLSNRMFE